MKHGFVYCLSNRGHRNIYKVGLTTKTIEGRMKELYKTGVVYPFQCEFAKRVKDVFPTETLLHEKLSKYRCSKEREFFEAPLPVIRKAFASINGTWHDHFHRPPEPKSAITCFGSDRKRRLKRKAHSHNPYAPKTRI